MRCGVPFSFTSPDSDKHTYPSMLRTEKGPEVKPCEPEELVKLLADPLVSSLFAVHPNQVGAYSLCPHEFMVPIEWQCWWDWAVSEGGQWKKLISLNDHYSRLLVRRSFYFHQVVTHLIGMFPFLQKDDVKKFEE